MRAAWPVAVFLGATLAGCVDPDRLLCPPDTVIVPTASRTAPTGFAVNAVAYQKVTIGSYLYRDLEFAVTFATGDRASGSLVDAFRAAPGAPLRLERERAPEFVDLARLGAGQRFLSNGTAISTFAILDEEGWILASFPDLCRGVTVNRAAS